ncbi:hypothetical protein [Lentibacillus sp. CBA3610]|uniref:hypothetical protein n=1 Tax=Lentibacillus sp. CBA3610 TaxID=2518176 RepID=UPI001595E5DD|nr:hypothetical protein [Lentibacillus sp. CBA3610]QKY69686.1 hypothetical protein Len3610_08830 [Lentibacillus sp. CBA3610]
MKKIAVLLTLSALVLVGCIGQESLIHEDLQKDIDQIIPIIEDVHNNDEEMSNDEYNLYEDFYDKYIIGKFTTSNGEEYKMNDLEKAIIREINTMQIFAYSVTDSEMTLESEGNINDDLYNEAKENFEKYTSMDEVPDELEGEYPVYTQKEGKYPSMFVEDVNKIIEMFDPVVNGSETNIENNEYVALTNTIEKYTGEGFEHNDKHYLINFDMNNIIINFDRLKDDLEQGELTYEVMNLFNNVKQDINDL